MHLPWWTFLATSSATSPPERSEDGGAKGWKRSQENDPRSKKKGGRKGFLMVNGKKRKQNETKPKHVFLKFFSVVSRVRNCFDSCFFF